MSRLALILFALVLGTHAGYPLLASMWPDPDAAARSWFYVLRGIEGAALFLVVAALARREWSLIAACLWGAAEEAQTAVCRLSLPMGEATSVLSGGLCDEVLPVPVYLTGAIAVGAAYCWSKHASRHR